MAGTIYAEKDSDQPLVGATVQLTDHNEVTYTRVTNCVGNFYFLEEEVAPRYPVWVKISFGNIETEMLTPMFQPESCASCHTDPAGPSSPGKAYLSTTPLEAVPEACL